MKKIKIYINSEIDLCSAHRSGVFYQSEEMERKRQRFVLK